MPRHPKSAVRKYHDRVAARYDASYEDAYWQWHDALTWRYLRPFLPRDLRARVLDLGCGTGKWAARIAKSGYAVTCVDISPRMLDQARLKLDPLDPAGRAAFVQADLCNLGALDRGVFPLAVALGDPIGCAESPIRAMKEIRRVLTGDGVLVATFDNKLSAIDFYLTKGDPRELARFVRDGRTHWLTQDAAERFDITTFSPSGVRRLAEQCGFDLLEILGKTVLPMRHHRQLLETPEGRRAWTSIETSLCRDPDALGRATHLQAVFRAHSR
jgi:SAM-dependent methyltransferase